MCPRASVWTVVAMATSTSTPVPLPISSEPPDGRGLQRAGGVAALVKAATYLVGFGVLGAYLVPRGFLDAQDDPAAALAFLLENQAAMYAWYLVLYLVGGAALVSLVLALHDRLRRSAPALSQTASVFGHIWAALLLASGLISLVGQRTVVDLAAADAAAAAAVWASVSVVQAALGGGLEVVGATWVLLLGLAGIRSGALGRGLSALGVGVGAAGLLTLVPPAYDLAGFLFGAGFIVWFVWAALALRRGPVPARR